MRFVLSVVRRGMMWMRNTVSIAGSFYDLISGRLKMYNDLLVVPFLEAF
jgi:hypothetical protein